MSTDSSNASPGQPDLFAPLNRPRRVRSAERSPGELDPGDRATLGVAHHTADRGYGAPNPQVAREAVIQDAVTHGSSDPDSPWTRRRRSRAAVVEHLAIGSGVHLELFEFTPGSRTVASRPVNPFTAFADAWRESRERGDASSRDFHGEQFARAHGVRIERHRDPTLAAGTQVTIEVDRVGYTFTASAAALAEALDTLAYRVRCGPTHAAHPARPAPRHTTAIEHARAEMAPEERLIREAYTHFVNRKILFSRARESGRHFTLSDRDTQLSDALGIPRPPDAAYDSLTAYFQAIDAKTRAAEYDAWYGLTAELLPGEAQERIQTLVGQHERRVNDRYAERPSGPDRQR